MIKLLKSRLDEVIRTDATVVGTSDFLATHMPFGKLTYKNSGTTETEERTYEENEFFNEFFQENIDKHGFIVVQGDSGSGKSHFIRWLKYKYDNEIVNNTDVSILIERSKNTLKGTIEQILDNKIIKESLDEVDRNKLLNAGGKLSEEKLVYTLAYQFVAEIESEEDDDCKVKSSERSLLANFLKDDLIIKKLLLKSNGPINRIKTRLISDDKIEVEVTDSLFVESDFNFDYEDEIMMDLADEEKGGNKKAIRCAEKIIENRRDFKERIIDYLNSKIDSVIQSVISLNTEDMSDIFNKIRTKLKEQDKTLTLFIEDITSFSGIDKALTEVLVKEHFNDDKICKLFSVVGVTKAYYLNQFPDNIKARVTGRIGIEKESIFNDEKNIFELTAKYLNAITQEKNNLDIWVDNGAVDGDLPISNMFLKHKWSLFEDSKGRTLSLYPFNKNAIINLYDNISEKTPRAYIREVIKAMMNLYIKNKEEFPPSIEIAKYSLKIPRWKNSLVERNLEQRFDENQCKRINTFINTWGNGTIDRIEVNGETFIGGIELELFKDFNIPIVNENTSKSIKDSKIDIGNKREENLLTTEKIEKVIEVSNKKENAIKTTIVNKINREEKEFKNHEIEINGWFENNEVLRNHKKFRDSIVKFLQNSIDWEYEGISKYLVVSKINANRIFIEGQQSEINKNGFVLSKSKETRDLLLSMSAYLILGNRSWDFNEAYDYTLNLNLWLFKNKENIIEYVKEDSEVEENSFKAALVSEYYYKAINGLITGNENEEQVFKILLEEKKLNLEKTTEFLGEFLKNLNSEKENIDNNKKFLLTYFNSILSTKLEDINKTDKIYLDSYKVLEYIKEIKENDYRLEKYKDVDNKLNYGIRLCKVLWDKNLDKLVDEKINNINKDKNKILNLIGDKKDIEETLETIKVFFNNFLLKENIIYKDEVVRVIKDGKLTAKNLITLLEVAENVLDNNLNKKINLLVEKKLDRKIAYISKIFNEIDLELNKINKDCVERIKQDKDKKDKLNEAKAKIEDELREIKTNIFQLNKE